MDAELATETPFSNLPIPPRYRWLKRIGVLLLVIVPILGAVRFWWGRIASTALDRAIQETRLPGIPTELHEFDQPPVPDEQNAALSIQRALGALALTKEQTDLIGSRRKAAGDEERRDFLEATREARELARQARSLPGCDFGFRFRSFNSPVPRWQGYSDLSHTLILSIQYLHDIGQDTEAVETMRDALSLARRLSQMGPLLSGLIAIGISELSSDFLQKIGPDLAVSPQVASNQVRALIVDLSDDTFLMDAVTRGLAFDRGIQISVFQEATRSTGALRSMLGRHWRMDFWYWLMYPAYQLDGAKLLREQTPPIIAARQSHWPDAERILSTVPQVPRASSPGRPLSSLIAPNWSKTVELSFPILARQRLTTTALAMWLYEREHGRLPAQLEDLVPDYLPKIPEDPLLTVGTTLKYFSDSRYPLISCGTPTDRKGKQLTVRLKSKPDVTTRED